MAQEGAPGVDDGRDREYSSSLCSLDDYMDVVYREIVLILSCAVFPLPAPARLVVFQIWCVGGVASH
jgi:hypothetical protein